MAIDLNDIRIRLNQQTEKIISGFKDRSRYLLNNGIYTHQFYNGRTWFEHRLFRDQCTDSEFGRYEFDDQRPILFRKEDLTRPVVKRDHPKGDLISVDIQIGRKVVDLYRKVLPHICKSGEDVLSYGETAKTDSSNVLSLHERICGLGPFVAESKLQKDPSISFVLDVDELRARLVDLKREEEVIENAVSIAKSYGLPGAEIMRLLFRGIIDLTLEVEIRYILLHGQKH